MTLSLTLPPEVETKIRERAALSGQSPDVYAARACRSGLQSHGG